MKKNRNKWMQFRFSEQEQKLLQELSDYMGMNKSETVRTIIRDAAVSCGLINITQQYSSHNIQIMIPSKETV